MARLAPPSTATVKVGVAQTRQSSSFADNTAAVLDALESAADEGVQILCFPETQTVGYRVDIFQPLAPVPVAALTVFHTKVAVRCGELGMACVLGTETLLASDETGTKPYNTALVIREDGAILGMHHKACLAPLDAVAYSPGDGDYQCFVLHGVPVGVVICYEGFRFAHSTAVSRTT